MRWLVVAALISACYRPTLEAPCTAACDTAGAAGACPGDQVCGTDLRCHAAGDAECNLQPDASGEICVGHAFLKVCFVPTDDVVLQTQSINTDDDRNCTFVLSGAPAVCAIVGSNITVGAGVQVTGTRAFAIAAADTLTIMGSLDGSSHAGGQSGPGATTPASGCTVPIPPTSGTTGSGGAGGSFQALGGVGGKGAGSGVGGSPASTLLAADLEALSGPCLAGAGSDLGGGNAGDKGFGGGAIALLASNLSIVGIVNASGGGGAGGRKDNGGGGGGGAGGMILLDADTIAVSGIVVANGGGGGGGAGAGAPGGDGMAGSDPVVTPPLTGGAGGGGSQLGGHGGAGGGTAVTQGSLGLPSTTNGAGGGGGGVGYILTTATITTGTLSPAPSPI